MNRLLGILLVFLLFCIGYLSAQTFTRTAEIKDPSALERGFGGVIAGVDFDGDGLPEIYACNTNMVDEPYELVPRLYKFEWNPASATWDSVWGIIAPVEFQNTWPALAYGDLDKDGKMEIIWGPVNNLGSDLNPARILVYEYPGDGSDNMGVDDGFGGWEPNAKTSIVTQNNVNLRPIRFIIADVDGDNTDEIVFCDRAGSWHAGVVSVDDIPDNGGGLETWTVEYSAEADPNFTSAGISYDLVVVNNEIFIINSDGSVSEVKFENGSYSSFAPVTGVAENNSSFKGSVTVRFADNTFGVYVGSWLSSKVYYVDKDLNSGSLVSYEVADFAPYAVRLNGADWGDLDNDGNPDIVFGSRFMAGNTAKVPIFRLAYKGGDKTDPANYETSIIDSAYWNNNGDMDVICLANVDGDPADEVIYTQGYSRGNPTDAPMPIIILDSHYTPVSTEQQVNTVPAQFFVDQNYPNPFNPSTQIKFGIPEASNVDLRVYDVLGREIAVLIDNEYLGAGSYNTKFDAVNLASGIYIYKLTAGTKSVSQKMQLLK